MFAKYTSLGVPDIWSEQFGLFSYIQSSFKENLLCKSYGGKKDAK